jgi:RNA 2',3'-cyclic 3'-phosphodiesterase
MRLFIAAYPPEDVLDDLAYCVQVLNVSTAEVNARVSARPLWHVTLAFLGEVPDERVPEAGRAVDRAAERIASARPQLRLEGGGRFGRGRFTLIWAGLGGDTAGLARIADTVRRELKASRLPYDMKRFAPHLTLARPGDRLPAESIAEDVETLAAYRGPRWTVDAIHVVASYQGPQPRHEIIHTAPC